MVGVISSEKKKHPGWMSINQFNLFLKKKNIWMNVNQSIHKGNFFFRIIFSCLSLLVSFLNIIKQTVLVICWFAEDWFEYQEVWCLRGNPAYRKLKFWRAKHKCLTCITCVERWWLLIPCMHAWNHSTIIRINWFDFVIMLLLVSNFCWRIIWVYSWNFYP